MATGSWKRLQVVPARPERHWVGDGFHVRSLFSYGGDGALFDPFLLLDYAEPAEFPPTDGRRGVGEHPHRGFETVTVVYAGEVEHRDSSGAGGRIGPGGVQWMTAGSGVVHEEFHGREFARRGGPFEMVQLWVNLPTEHKMTTPRYQGIDAGDIPSVALPGDRGRVRVIAGDFEGADGPAETFTPMHLWDLDLRVREPLDLPVPDGWTTALLVRRGEVRVPDAEPIGAGRIALFERSGDALRIEHADDAAALLLCGEPIGEPVVGSGPFVMNTADEIRQAISDYQAGRMGGLS